MQAAAEAYAEAVQTKPAHEVEPFAQAIKDLRAEQDAVIAKGANACDCGKFPMGMIKTPSYPGSDGLMTPAVYEVGCIYCPQYLIETESGVRRRSVSARGHSPEEAVSRWNAGEWVVDSKFEKEPVDSRVGGLTHGRKIARFAENGAISFETVEA